LVSDHRVVREGLCKILGREPGIDVVAESGIGMQAIRSAEAIAPDLMLMDASAPDTGVIDVARQVAEKMPSVSVLLLSESEQRENMLDALTAGVRGVLPKECTVVDLVAAIRTAVAGGTYLSQGCADLLLKEYAREPAGRPAVAAATLTPVERQVLRLIAQEKNAKEIAFLLKVSVKTVETYRHKIMRKLGLKSIAELVRYAIRKKMVSVGQ